MESDRAQRIVADEPTYTGHWSAGQSCSVCGALLPANAGEMYRHTDWHAAVRTLLEPVSDGDADRRLPPCSPRHDG